MTLIVTNVSRHGVVMVADSAETWPMPGDGGYVRTGVRKVVPVWSIGAGISMWGVGSVNGYPMDLWVEDFVRAQVKPDWTLRKLCESLADGLNREGVFPGPSNDAVGGFHVAGYEDHGAGSLPGVYHVHSKHPHEQPHELRVYHDFPEYYFKGDYQKYRQELEAGYIDWHLRNGAFQPFVYIWDALAGRQKEGDPPPVLARLAQLGVRCPFPDTLPERARFYAFLVEIVARLFSMSSYAEIISLPLSVLTIGPNGICDYQPSLRRARH